MEAIYIASWIIFLLSTSAAPEIPSKDVAKNFWSIRRPLGKSVLCPVDITITNGKQTQVQDAQQTSVEDADMPRFAEHIANVTVSVGRDALLACVVENLKGYKVAWVRVETQTILSIHHNVISQNNRISLTYNDHRSWYLHIKEVEESDRGWYMCQINTDPMRSRKGYLQVVVPPLINEGMTSNDMVVREGLNVTLMCKARGYPEPYVMWRREDGEEMLVGGEHVNVVDGELLHITKVSRLHMAAYLCVASNGVPPSISKRVHLRVQFPPMLSIPNQLEGAYLGQNVVLECHTEAYPASINYWTTERGDMIISDTSRAGDKYETTSTVNGYTKYMKLKIRSVGTNDFGTYRCVAKNSLGETDGNIKLDEMPAPTITIISENAVFNRSLGNVGDNNQTPVRNLPDAFHNSAGALSQNNLLGNVIHWIKMQSFGILEHLPRILWNYSAAPKVIRTQSTTTETVTTITLKIVMATIGIDLSKNKRSVPAGYTSTFTNSTETVVNNSRSDSEITLCRYRNHDTRISSNRNDNHNDSNASSNMLQIINRIVVAYINSIHSGSSNVTKLRILLSYPLVVIFIFSLFSTLLLPVVLICIVIFSNDATASSNVFAMLLLDLISNSIFIYYIGKYRYLPTACSILKQSKGPSKTLRDTESLAASFKLRYPTR